MTGATASVMREAHWAATLRPARSTNKTTMGLAAIRVETAWLPTGS